MGKRLAIFFLCCCWALSAAGQSAAVSESPFPGGDGPSAARLLPHYQWEVDAVAATLPEGGVAGAETVQGMRVSQRLLVGAGLGVFALISGRDRAWPTSVGLRPTLDVRPYLALSPFSEVYLDLQMGALCPLAKNTDIYFAVDLGLGARVGHFNAAICLTTLDFSSAGVMLKAGVAF